MIMIMTISTRTMLIIIIIMIIMVAIMIIILMIMTATIPTFLWSLVMGVLATPKEIEQSKSTQTVVDFFRFCWGLLYIISTSPISETGHPSY